MRISIPLLFAAASAVVADESAVDTILGYLQQIATLTANSTRIISEVSASNISTAVAVQSATDVLNSATYNATQAVEDLPNLSVNDAAVLGAYTQQLAYGVNHSIATLISKKPEFEKLGIASLVVTSLKGLAAGSYFFSLATLQKIPTELQPVSAALSSQIGESIQMGIECFNGTNSSCNTAEIDPNRTRLQAIANEAIPGAAPKVVQATAYTALVGAIFAAVMVM